MNHWSDQKEKKASAGHMRLLFLCYKYCGANVFRVFLHPVVFFFYLFSGSTRQFSKEFLKKVDRVKPGRFKIRFKSVYWHFYCFSYSLIEKLSAWSGDISSSSLINCTEDEGRLASQLSQGKGAVVLCSHLGNMEMLRAFGRLENGKELPAFQTISIVDFSGTAQFNTLLEEINPQSMIKLVNANSIDPSTIIYLKERIDAGDLVVIAGDRTSGNNREKVTPVSFLGEEGYFPQGAFVLACLLEAPIYHMFAVREDDFNLKSSYEFYVYKSSLKHKYSRKNRNEIIYQLTKEYAGHLESLCIQHPFQWFNFFDFWDKPLEKSLS